MILRFRPCALTLLGCAFIQLAMWPFGSSAQAADESLGATQLTQLKASTVLVLADQGSGSGFVYQRLSENAILVGTNRHVVGHATQVHIVFGSGTAKEQSLSGQIVALGAQLDLALIRVEGKSLPAPLEMAAEDKLLETQNIWVLGFPFGDALTTNSRHPAMTITRGTITSLRRDERSELQVVQIDADINPGNSGGPVVDSRGKLVGLATAKLNGTAVGMAIPSKKLTALVAGEINTTTWERVESDVNKATYKVTATITDPLGKISGISVHLIPSDKIPSDGAVPENGPIAPGMREEALKISDRQAEATVVFKAGKPPVTGYSVQFKIRRASGVLWTLPEIFSVDFPDQPIVAGPLDPKAPIKPEADDWIGGKKDSAAGVGKAKTPAEVSSKNLLGEDFTIGDATAFKLSLPMSAIKATPLRSADGKSLYVLETGGILHQVTLPACTETLSLDFAEATTLFALSREGLLVYISRTQELAVIDAKTFKQLRRIALPGINELTAAAGSNLAYATNGNSIYVIDVARGVLAKTIAINALQATYGQRIKRHADGVILGECRLPTLTPDGKTLICMGFECLHRFRCEGQDLIYEEMGPRIGQNAQRLEISEDGTYVALPSGGGNYPVADHPKAPGYSTFVYKVTNLQRPATIIASGHYPRALAFDKKAGRIYAMNYDFQFLVFTPQGVKEKEYKLERQGETRFILPLADGDRALVGTENSLFLIELPGAKGAIRPPRPTWNPTLVSVIGKSGELLSGTTQRDAQGQSFIELTSKPQTVPFEKTILGVCAAPSGEALYVVHRDQPVVSIINPANWEVIGEIIVPQSPVAVWTDGQILAVACPTSKAIALIDPLKRELIRTVRCPTRPDWFPDTICGRSPDGGLATLWQKTNGSSRDRALISVAMDGTTRVIGEGKDVFWGAWLPGGKSFFMNGDFSSSPSGIGDLITPGGDPHLATLHSSTLFGSGASFHCDTAPVFTTFDQSALVYSRRLNDSKGPSFQTYLLPATTDRILMEFPGIAVCEVPDQRILVTLDKDRSLSSEDADCYVVRYISRSSGRLLRKVHLATDKDQREHCKWINYMRPACGAVYIPGHEILLIPNERDFSGPWTAYRCGPISGAPDSAADATIQVKNDPPAKAAAGQTLRFAPAVSIAGGSKVVYRLKRALPGMTIDAESGTWSWTPTAAQAGTWQVTIVATADGKDVPVVSWSLTVE